MLGFDVAGQDIIWLGLGRTLMLNSLNYASITQTIMQVLLRQNVKTTIFFQVKTIWNVSVQSKQAKHCLNQFNTRFQMKTIFFIIFAITSASVKSVNQSSSNM